MALAILQHRSLKTRIVLTTLAIFIASLWALSFYSSHMLRIDTERMLGQQQFSTVTYVAQQLDSELNDRVKALEMIARVIDSASIDSPADLQKFVDQRFALHNLFNAGLNAYRADGTVIAVSPMLAERIGMNYMDRDYVSGALQEGRATIGHPVFGRTLRSPIIGMAVPIRDAQGSIVGALGGLIDLDRPSFLDKITHNNYGKTGGYLVVEKQHRLVVTASDKRRIMQALPAPGESRLTDRFIEGFEGSGITINPFGEDVLASAKGIPVAGWYVAASLPTKEAFAPIREMQQRMLLATVLLTLLAGGMTAWIVRRQFSPLQRTARTIAGMADENAPLHTLPVADADEIGQLNSGFNRLLETLGRRERALQTSETRFRIISSICSDLLYSCTRSDDGQFRITWIAGDATPLFGYDTDTIMARGCWKPFVIEEDLPLFAHTISEGRPGVTSDSVVRIRHRDGSIRYLRSVARVEADETDDNSDSGCHQLYGALQDITERMRSEAELEQHRHHLAELVASRTAELAEAKDAAEAASLAKSAFLANMSHEIRTPMNAILGMVNVLRRSGISPLQGERLAKIDAATEHLLSIINNILDLSKIEAGKFVFEEAPVNPGDVLRTTGTILLERAHAKGLRLIVESDAFPADSPLRLYGDATRLQQALLNYATNAIKFTERGSVSLRLRVQEEAEDSRVVRFEVQDTGIGIDEDVLPRLFGSFEQADNSTTRKYGGTGLGLAITRRLAELMGGEAGAHSTPGVGSTFWFTARLSQRNGPDRSTPIATVESAEEQLRQRHRGRKILVVDDDPMNLEVARYLLEDAGLSVSAAEDGLRAIIRAQDKGCAAVLMDMQMPNMDGLDATRHIRRIAGCHTMPILAMTANAFAEDKASCLAAGMNDFVVKPFDPEVLFSTLLHWLDRDKSSETDPEDQIGHQRETLARTQRRQESTCS